MPTSRSIDEARPRLARVAFRLSAIPLLIVLLILPIFSPAFAEAPPTEQPNPYLTGTPTPGPRFSRPNVDSVAATLPWVPTVVPSVPQPSAFFVPRMITVTARLDQFPGSRLQGRVLDWRGNPMSGISVRASGGPQELVAMTNNDGSYAIDGLPAGTYSVSVAGYGGLPAQPLPVDGRSIFIVEFIEAVVVTTPTVTPAPTTPPASHTVQASTTATISPTPSRTPAAAAVRSTPTPKPESFLLSSGELDYLKRLLLTPFVIGAAGGYAVFLLGIIGATLRRR